jgi:hypothetical protein
LGVVVSLTLRLFALPSPELPVITAAFPLDELAAVRRR